MSPLAPEAPVPRPDAVPSPHRPPAQEPATTGPEGDRPPHPPGGRVQGAVVIGLSLVAVTAVAGSLLAFGPGAPLAQAAAPAATGSPSAAAEAPALVELTGEYATLRYPEGWEVAGPSVESTDERSPTLVFRTITAPGGAHTFCFDVHRYGADVPTSREQVEEWEADFLASGGSTVRRVALEEDASAPPGWDTTRLELTYTHIGWDEPDRWTVWQYTVIEEEGRGYLIQADIPAADLPVHGDLVDAVLDSFEPVL
ncbi:hypothetical protein ACIRPH_04295 [Nocardiopsis sp. NPDC101807]|uniref:hypothetical protein n=1 Tax=Nocardiopsis sp. NPDC101807 TaxID=3364339 RepID=UPI003827FCDE